MRKIQKKLALEFVGTLNQALGEIKKSIERNNISLAQDLLAECQQNAIKLGNTIENLAGEEVCTVHYIEDYCEQLFCIHEELEQSIHGVAKKSCKKLQKQLCQIENSIVNDIPTRIEAVFLPYKASMWDSLESVWMAANEDENCDAYVIPIPYYDKNPDGSFKEEHYEGAEYPHYVPIIQYNSYNFAERHPDIIFIHNPYDECNYVTSVHPFFYSKNLKQYTDKLVYIPYFILEDISPYNQYAIDGMKHFCMTPGVIYSDKVIVQSEEMRQIYINVLIKESGDDNSNKAYWENKILGLGSPKIDKVIYTNKEDIEIPADWLKIIQRLDGSWKKIVLYNTSVSALLKYDEQMLIKIESVLQKFQKYQNEVVLLWRPHPLIQATIESMRPQLWCKYKKIVEKYQENNWGIYDESSDLDRAVIISDAYYGDRSSVNQLFKKTCKPILIQDATLIDF